MDNQPTLWVIDGSKDSHDRVQRLLRQLVISPAARPPSRDELVAAFIKAVKEGTIEGGLMETWKIDDPGGFWLGVDGPGTYVVVPVGEEPK